MIQVETITTTDVKDLDQKSNEFFRTNPKIDLIKIETSVHPMHDLYYGQVGVAGNQWNEYIRTIIYNAESNSKKSEMMAQFKKSLDRIDELEKKSGMTFGAEYEISCGKIKIIDIDSSYARFTIDPDNWTGSCHDVEQSFGLTSKMHEEILGLKQNSKISRENMLKLRYTSLGILEDKLYVTYSPSMAVWSKSRKCLITKENDSLELIDRNGKLELTNENNILISLQVHLNISEEMVKKINNSDGIIITDYDEVFYRFGMIQQ